MGNGDEARAWGRGGGAGRDRGDVTLKVTDEGTSQTFSLTHGRRAGPVPEVHYRDPYSVTETDSVDQTVTDATADYGGSATTAQITVSDVSLDYVSPNGQPAPGPDQAWVVPQLSATTVQGGPLFDFQPAPRDWLHLVLPDGTSVPAQSTPLFQGNDLLGATYWFPAPADITSAQLVFGPGNVLGDQGLFTVTPRRCSCPTPCRSG